MKQTATTATPTIKYINNIPYVRVIDLAHQWNTASSNVLAVGKPHHVPEEYLRRIDGRVWCSFAGLRYRLTATHTGSRITRHIREFLDAQAAKKPLEPEPEPTDTTSRTLAQKNEKRISELMDVIHDLQDKTTETNAETFTANEKAAQATKVSHATRNRSRNNAHRLARQAMRIDKLEHDARGKYETLIERVRLTERRQQDDRARIVALEEKARAIDWSMTAVAVLSIAARLIRWLHRR